MDLRKTETIVRDILAKSERARNDDHWLIIRVMKEQGQDIRVTFDKGNYDLRKKSMKIVWTIPNEELDFISSFESITRARRKIQSRGEYLPTDITVLRRRRLEETYKAYGCN